MKWLYWVATTSIPIRKLDANRLPIGTASGCMIEYRGKRFFLSVSHAIKEEENWVIEIKYDPENGAEVYKPYYSYINEFRSSNSSFKNIDFCYAEVPLDLLPIFQQINETGKILEEFPRHVFKTPFTAEPDTKQTYAFSGQVFPERIGNKAFYTQPTVYPGLRFIKQEEESLIFELPVKHPGDEHFFGCSGAPIVDMNKNVVALVCSGDAATNTIRGIAINRYKTVFEVIA